MTLGELLLRTVLSSAVGGLVSLVVTRLALRAARRNRVDVERMLSTFDQLVSVNSSITIVRSKGHRMPQLDQYRKAIAAGVGVMLTGVLTWAESADLEPVLGPLVPEPFRPLVGVALGGLATVVAVIKATNAGKPGPVRTGATITVSAPPAPDPQEASDGSQSAGTTRTAAADATPPADEATAAAAPVSLDPRVEAALLQLSRVGNETSVVQLAPAPERSYQ